MSIRAKVLHPSLSVSPSDRRLLRGPHCAAAVLASVVLAAGCSGTRESGEGTSAAALVISPDLVISQVYGGGGNSNATYKNDFVELFNRSAATVNLGGKSIQYASSTGSFSSTANKIDLPSVDVPAGGYFLIKLGSGGTTGADLPGPDHTDVSLNMSGSSGKVALVSTALSACGTAAAPCTDGAWIDLVGYGTASQAEGSPIGALTSTTAAIRKGAGCEDTGVNAADFDLAGVTPRNSGTAANACGDIDAGPPVDAGTDTNTTPDTSTGPDANDGGAPTDSGSGSDGGTAPDLVLLNEIRINPPGSTDAPFEFAEVLCTPSSSLDGYYFVAFEGDGDSQSGTPGTADIVVPLNGVTCGVNGLVYIKASSGGTAPIDADTTVVGAADLNTGSSPLENATTSFVIIHSPSTPIVKTTDYDTDNNGNLELPNGASVVDGVSTFDQSDGAVDQTYAPRLPNVASPADAATRFPGDTTALNAASWYYGDLTGTTGDSVDYNTSAVSSNFPSDGQLTPGGANVGTGATLDAGPPHDGGSTDSGSSTKDSGSSSTDSGTSESDGGSSTKDGGGSSSSSDAGTKKDSGKSTGGTSNEGDGSGGGGGDSGGCSVSEVGESGTSTGAIGALFVALSAMFRRRRRS